MYGGPFDNKWTEENKTASRLNPEIAKKLNVGIDLGFLNDRLAFTFDYYQNKFSDVVATSEIKTAILGNVYPRSIVKNILIQVRKWYLLGKIV